MVHYAISCWWSFGTESLHPAVFEILRSKAYWGHEFDLSRSWPWRHRSHDHLISRSHIASVSDGPVSQNNISHRQQQSCSSRIRMLAIGHVIIWWWSFGTESLNPAVFEILRSKCIGVTSLNFQGHMTSSVGWPLDSPYAISYWWSFGTSLYL